MHIRLCYISHWANVHIQHSITYIPENACISGCVTFPTEQASIYNTVLHISLKMHAYPLCYTSHWASVHIQHRILYTYIYIYHTENACISGSVTLPIEQAKPTGQCQAPIYNTVLYIPDGKVALQCREQRSMGTSIKQLCEVCRQVRLTTRWQVVRQVWLGANRSPCQTLPVLALSSFAPCTQQVNVSCQHGDSASGRGEWG